MAKMPEITYPCYIPARTQDHLPVTLDMDSDHYLPIITDQDLVARFFKHFASGKVALGTIVCDDMLELGDELERCKALGITKVIFDPAPVHTGLEWTIDEVIAYVKQPAGYFPMIADHPDIVALGQQRLQQLCNEWLKTPDAKECAIKSIKISPDCQVAIEIDISVATLHNQMFTFPADRVLNWIIDQSFTGDEVARLKQAVVDRRRMMGPVKYQKLGGKLQIKEEKY